MKLFLKILSLIILVAALAVGASILLLPKERIISEMKSAFLRETGRTLDFSEDVSLSFYPNIGVIIRDVSLSNADWAGGEKMVDVTEAEVLLELEPLLDKEIVVKRFILKEPVIRLQMAEDGRANWELKAENANNSEAGDETPGAATNNAERLETAQIQIKPNLIEIVNGKLIYTNEAKNVSEEISDIDLLINVPDLNGAAEVEGSLSFKQEAVELQAELESIPALLSGSATPAKITLNSAPLDLEFEGNYTPKEKHLMQGALSADVHSMTQLGTLTGLDLKNIALPFDSFSMRMQGSAGLEDLSYEAFNFQADGINVSGKGRVIYAGERPFLGGTYNFDHIDMDRFLAAADATPKEAEKATSEDGDQIAGALAKSGKGWSNRPIDYGFLNSVNTNITANVDKYTYDGISFGPNTLQLEIKDAVMELNISDTPIFGGKINQTAILDTAATPPTLRINAKVKNVEAREAFSYLADYDRLSGKMDATLFNVTAQARSMKSIADSLAGTVDFLFKDGEIRGVNVVDWAKAFQKRYANINPGFEATPFVSLGGSFNIAGGIARNDNLRMRGPLANVTGSGNVNIGQKTLDYDIRLTLLQPAEGVPGGVTMPFDVTGSWSDPKVRPDIGNLVENIIKNPKAAEDQLKNLKETGKELEDRLNENENVKAIKGLIKSF